MTATRFVVNVSETLEQVTTSINIHPHFRSDVTVQKTQDKVAIHAVAHNTPHAKTDEVASVIGERLTEKIFTQISGNLAGYPFVKVVVDNETNEIHFLNNQVYQFHSDYIGEKILGVSKKKIDSEIDDFNYRVYRDPKRRFYLGILALHKLEDRSFLTLETVEVDTMNTAMIEDFYRQVRENVDPSFQILFKPASHLQENYLNKIDSAVVPRIHPHNLFASAKFIPLNNGTVSGRLRAFGDFAAYRAARASLEWFDIIVMSRVPDDIPRVSGIINADYTTPLSHTNVLASGWQIPNCIQIGILDRIKKEKLDNEWVELTVSGSQTQVLLKQIEKPDLGANTPAWKTTKIQLETPEVLNTQILPLDRLRMTDRFRYGTKAANLGELNHVLAKGSPKLTGFYRIRRPPRPNLIPYLAARLEAPESTDLAEASWKFLKARLHLPLGIAIPFAFQQRFFESSSRVQQAVGKLKMALELNAPQIDSLCVQLQHLIIETRFPETLRDEIDRMIAEHLAGVSRFVIRSSSNAEDLQNFSAAGIYESINHVTKADLILESIKQVWASVVSPRSVRLRQDVGISLDDTYMGVIVQEEIPADMGGVMVTTNPVNRGDFRNVYINVAHSSIDVVEGKNQPRQYLFNTVEGGGQTVSLGGQKEDLSEDEKTQLANLALAGRLLQSHFSPDYTFSMPMDIEWLVNESGVYVLQLRPYSY